MPAFVLNECLANSAQSGAKEISIALDKKLIHLHENPDQNQNLFDILGMGEASA